MLDIDAKIGEKKDTGTTKSKMMGKLEGKSIGWQGEELEAYYLSGVCDGIRLFRWIMKQ